MIFAHHCAVRIGNHKAVWMTGVDALWADAAGMQDLAGTFSLHFSWNKITRKSQKMPNHTNIWSHQIAAILWKKHFYSTTKKTRPKNDAFPAVICLPGNDAIFQCKHCLSICSSCWQSELRMPEFASTRSSGVFGYTTCFEWFNSEVKMFTHHCMYLTLCFISLDKHSGNFQTVICGVNCSLHTQLYKINDSTLRSWFSKQHEHWHLLVTVFIEYFQILDGVRLFVRNRSMSLRDFSPSKWPNVARPQPSDRQQRRKGRKLGRSFWKYEELLQLHRTSFFFSRTELMLPLCWHKPPRILVGKRGKQKNPFRLATVGCVSCVWCNMVGNVRATFILALMKPVQNTVDLSHLMPK